MICVLCTGCWDLEEINDVTIVVATALDKSEDEKKYRASFQIPLPGELAPETGGGKPYYVDSSTGDAVTDINARIQSRLPRKFIFSHRRLLLLGEPLAAEMGIQPLFDALTRTPQKRLTAYMAVTDGPAYPYFNIQSQMELYSGEMIRELIQSQGVYTQNLKNVMLKINQTGIEAIIPYIKLKETKVSKQEKSKGQIELHGYAQLKEDKMVGTFTDDAAEGLLWMIKDAHPLNTSLQVNEDQFISVNNIQSETSITPVVEGEDITFDLSLHVTCGVVEDSSNKNLFNNKNIEEVQQKVEEKIKRQMNEALELIKKNKADSIGFGLYIKHRYPYLWNQSLKKNWPEKIPSLAFHTNVDVTIENIGLISENLTKEEE